MITSKQLNRLRDEAYATACNKGFHDEKHSDEHYLMLVITEIAEAVQADRKGTACRQGQVRLCGRQRGLRLRGGL